MNYPLILPFLNLIFSILLPLVLNPFKTENHRVFPVQNSSEENAARKYQRIFNICVTALIFSISSYIESRIDVARVQTTSLRFLSNFGWESVFIFILAALGLYVRWKRAKERTQIDNFPWLILVTAFALSLGLSYCRFSGFEIKFPTSMRPDYVSGEFNQIQWTLERNEGLLTIEGNTDVYKHENRFFMEFTARGESGEPIPINPPWLEWKDKITKVSIGDTIASIGSGAFRECTRLKTISISPSVERIGDNAFYCCKKLDIVEIPENTVVIGENTFFGCDSLQKITLGSRLRIIEDSAFSACDSLEEIVLPESVDIIGEKLFYECTSLKKAVLPTHISEISFGMFAGCTSLEQLEIPPSVTRICESAFQNCSSLRNVKIPEQVWVIQDYAFGQCTALEEISIPPKVSVMGTYVFQDCSKLKNIDIKNSIILRLESHVFGGCVSLEELDTPETLEVIDDNAFIRCTSLHKVFLYGKISEVGQNAFPARERDNRIQIYVNDSVPEEVIRVLHKYGLETIPQ